MPFQCWLTETAQCILFSTTFIWSKSTESPSTAYVSWGQVSAYLHFKFHCTVFKLQECPKNKKCRTNRVHGRHLIKKKKKRSSISLPWGSGVWGPGTMLVSGPHRQRHFFHLISASQHLTFFGLFLQNLPVLSFLYVYTIIIGKESKATEFGSCDLNHVIQFQCLWKKLTRKWPMQFPKINWLYFQTDIFLLVKENITREKQAKNNLVVPEVRCSRFTLKHLI